VRKIAILLASGLILSGCAASEPTVEETTETQQESNQTEQPQTGQLTPDDLPDVDSSEYQTVDSIEDAAIIAANTFDQFDKVGMVETLRGETGNVILVHNPEQKDNYSAAWINTADDTAELIFDAREFTSAWPFLLLSEPGNLENTYFGPQPGGFTLEYDDPSFGRYGYNYLTDGEKLLGAWWYLEEGNPQSAVVITYNYEVDQRWIDRLDVAVEDFLAEQPSE